ncbi:MAG: sodium:alanine symporter family protein [Clostridia bacterium]|nr:sodium:alanine symporter family protein [Clostridia bacterium]
MNISSILTYLDDNIAWGPMMLILLVGTGFYLSLRLNFLQFGRFGHTMKHTIGKLFQKQASGRGEVTPFQALTTALAATVGTGNIVGVTGAVFIGGPGAVFWMWIAAIVGMVTKYAEVTLAVKYRERNAQGDWVGGPMYYIKNGLGKKWEWLGALFCIFGALCAFGIGNATQVQSIATAINNLIDAFGGNTGAVTLTALGSTFTLSTLLVGIVVAAIVALVLIGGIKRIGSVTEKLVPFMAVIYIAAAVLVVGANFRYIGMVFSMILRGAFNAKAFIGGAGGAAILTSMKKGIGRGCFSNEAGLGSAPMAHAATSETNPVKQGLYGIFEVFMDTIVICTLTCLIVLSSFCTGNLEITWGTGGSATDVAAAIGSVLGGKAGALLIAMCLSLFALSTILSWSLYGTRCFEYLFGVKATGLYKTIFVLFVVVGATLSLSDVWTLASVLNGFMAIPNLIALLALSPVVVDLTKRYFREVDQTKA